MNEPAAPAAPARPPESRPLQLVFGASGYIGSHLVPELLAGGHRVRATARNVEVLEGRGWHGAELAQADALDPASLPDALAGVDVAYYLVHSMAAGRDFGAIDRRAAECFARAAAAAGVRRIVYLGGLIPPNPRSAHLKSRAETGEVLRAGTVPVTEVRAGNDHRPRFRSLRSHPRPREPPADDGHAVLGAFALDARSRCPTCLTT
jgi:uncharacterized protein YbjT (DUF2867 family)